MRALKIRFVIIAALNSYARELDYIPSGNIVV